MPNESSASASTVAILATLCFLGLAGLFLALNPDGGPELLLAVLFLVVGLGWAFVMAVRSIDRLSSKLVIGYVALVYLFMMVVPFHVYHVSQRNLEELRQRFETMAGERSCDSKEAVDSAAPDGDLEQ